MTRKVFLAMLEAAGFTNARLVGTGEYRTSAHTQATFYFARRPGDVIPSPSDSLTGI